MMKYRVALKMILLLVFVGWLIVWILIPTKVYQNHMMGSKLDTKLDSTYFREQGTNLLLFSFPIMFIACLSCLYLHLQTRNKSISSKSDFASLRRPMFVKAPLGIVTTVEVCFTAMFVALMVWSLVNYLYISYTNLTLYIDEGVEFWQARFRSISLRVGYIGNIAWAFLFFPVTRGSSILALVGLTSESSIKYHIWLGHISMILFLLHTVGFIIYWVMTHQAVLLLEWSTTYVSNVAGEIAMVLALVMWVTSLNRVRRKMFELFFYTHYLYTVYVIFYVLHVGAAYFCMILPGIFLFLIDRYLRFLQSRSRARLHSARILPCNVVELNFSKSPRLVYNPTSIMFINVPIISKLQWHPFTVISSSSMESDKLSILIKSEGSWSQKLYKTLSTSSHDQNNNLQVSVEGPYGPSSFSFLSHESLIMVSGGSGIAPFISIIREILFQSTAPKSHVPKIHLVCAFKTSSELSTLDLLLPISGSNSEQISSIDLKISAYVTQEQENPNTEAQNPVQTIFFKPNPLDSPVSATLGPNNWLWLGAIIASSFALFLVVLGLVTRYYIYPFDQIAGQYYHFSYRCLWDMFLICASICLVSSVAFVVCKKRNSMEDQSQINNVEMASPTVMSPASWSYTADQNIELESLPCQSLAQAMKVHFGARPNLKRILFDSKASDVGVLVCGPRKMRHEVAKICASGLADNLHFESISFNW